MGGGGRRGRENEGEKQEKSLEGVRGKERVREREVGVGEEG